MVPEQVVATAVVALAIVCVSLAFALPISLHIVLTNIRKIQGVGGEPVELVERKLEITASERAAAEDRRHEMQMLQHENIVARRREMANGG